MTGRQYNNHLLRIFVIAHQAAQKSAEKKEIIKETKENAQIVLVNIQNRSSTKKPAVCSCEMKCRNL